MPERRHRIRNHLEQPRRQRGERRSEIGAAIGCGISWRTPLSREHHGDEHLEPLHANMSQYQRWPLFRQLRMHAGVSRYPLLLTCACAT